MQTTYILWTWLIEGRPRATISALFMFTCRGILGYSTQLPLPQVPYILSLLINQNLIKINLFHFIKEVVLSMKLIWLLVIGIFGVGCGLSGRECILLPILLGSRGGVCNCVARHAADAAVGIGVVI